MMEKSKIIAAVMFSLALRAGAAQTPPADRGETAQGASAAAATMNDIPYTATTKLTIERRGQIVLIGINRPGIQNRVDPETFQALAKAYYDFDHDPSLRAAVLFGHG